MSADRPSSKKKPVYKSEIEKLYAKYSSKKNRKGKKSSDEYSEEMLIEQAASLSKDLTTTMGFLFEDEEGKEVFVPSLSQEILRFQILSAYMDPSVPISAIQIAIGQWYSCEIGTMTCNIRWDKLTPGKITEEHSFTPLECTKNYIH